ncbi:uncharacterized protein G2W53_015450 [Senna tora]|uniref:Uncharacterized protein n=1 Tax=Senna tora TaxID=362788 RepID=A0A835C9X8_9FABA|nr:uncharacterized protein G2W53_015450 [Senna tora]
MAYVQSPCTARDFYKTAHKQRVGFPSLTNNGKVFPAHLKRVGFHSLTNNEPK